MNDVPILVCDCGMRLRAPGAKPGRVGRCPACGGELRVPSARDEDHEPPAPPAPAPKPKKKRRKPPEPESTAIWDGLIPAPTAPEGLRESLLYPLWGATGITLLVIGPPVFWLATAPIIAVAGTWTASGTSTFSLGALFLALPGVMGFGLALGYTLLYLARVAASSALGESHHPRWPDWDLTSLASGLARWAWAGLIGGAIGGFPAIAYWVYCGDVDLFDAMILSELAAAGAVYALMALLASILHEDAWAANPWTVLAAIRRVGWGYAQPCLLAGASVVLASTVGAAAFRVEFPPLAAFLYWLFWLVVLYEAMVVLRVLGLFYHQHARDLGWFHGRTGWGV